MQTISRQPELTGALATHGRHPPRPWRPAGAARRVLESLFVWQERARQRHALAELDERLLKDIGLSRADVAREVSKPFWRT